MSLSKRCRYEIQAKIVDILEVQTVREIIDDRPGIISKENEENLLSLAKEFGFIDDLGDPNQVPVMKIEKSIKILGVNTPFNITLVMIWDPIRFVQEIFKKSV